MLTRDELAEILGRRPTAAELERAAAVVETRVERRPAPDTKEVSTTTASGAQVLINIHERGLIFLGHSEAGRTVVWNAHDGEMRQTFDLMLGNEGAPEEIEYWIQRQMRETGADSYTFISTIQGPP